MSKDIFGPVAVILIGGFLWFFYSLIGDWTILARLFAFQLGVTLIGVGLLAGLTVLIRSFSLGRLDMYVKRLNEAGYSAPKIDDYETRVFTISLLFATVLIPASVWLWYEIYSKSSFILLVFVAFTTTLGLWGTWSSIYTWKSVSTRLKQYCDRLNDGIPLSLPRLDK